MKNNPSTTIVMRFYILMITLNILENQ